MKKKGGPNRQIVESKPEAPKVQAPVQQPVQKIQQVQQAPQLTNANQQMLFNYQQMPNIQIAQNSNSMIPQMSNAQQQQFQQVQAPQRLPQNFGYVTPGVYGARNSAVQAPLPAFFNDDEPFLQSVKSVGKEAKVQITIKAQRSQVKMGENTILPAMCTIESTGGDRTSVDLICVIDVSGSMNGEKINLVKQTMKVLLQTLTPSDRLSIITFNSEGRRICNLKAITQQNMIALTQHVNELYAGGGTSIMSGMELALKTIRDRKIPNKVTSVFLLSDGQDKGAEQMMKQALARPDNSQLGVFSIHSFGFGTDHDEDLMNKICTLKEGAFYFIKQLATLDQAFCNALGGIISLAASEVTVSLRNIAKGLVEGIKISKVFGDKWKKINDRQYSIKITQLMSEITKEFVFELTIPSIPGQVGDIGRQHVVLQGIMAAKGINGQQMGGEANLLLTLINANEQIAEINENIQVIENYLRVKAAESIEENMKKAENNQFDEAQQGIDTMIQNIQMNKKARPEKMVSLVQDLQVIRQKCSKQEYQQEGRKWMVNAQNAHSNKANFQYSNNVQTQMVMERKSKKSGY